MIICFQIRKPNLRNNNRFIKDGLKYYTTYDTTYEIAKRIESDIYRNKGRKGCSDTLAPEMFQLWTKGDEQKFFDLLKI